MRVVTYSLLLGKALGLSEAEQQKLRWGALLHDIGKIAVPDHILFKPGPLTEDEWRVVRRHPKQGYEMLRQVSFLGEALDIVLHHHERWDGTGYPGGLEGKAIPGMARIFSVVDTHDAMASKRPYRATSPDSAIREELLRVAGRQLDPEFVSTFLTLDRGELDTARST